MLICQMSNIAVRTETGFDRNFCIESYGVKVRIESNDPELLDDARRVVRTAFVGRAEIIENGTFETPHSYGLRRLPNGEFQLVHNGEDLPLGDSHYVLLKYFNSRLRATVCEHAKSHVFVHAGAVARNGKAIIIPANSYKGKTTLVAELVRSGATYYSDEYAVFDETGLCQAFPRLLSVRVFEGGFREENIAAETLGEIGYEPVPVGMVLLTGFEENAGWKPEILTPGRGIIDVIPHTIPIRSNPEFSMGVLGIALSNAVFVKSPRGEAAEFAKIILSFFDEVVG